MDDQLGVLVESLHAVNGAAVQESVNLGVVTAALVLLAMTVATVFTNKSLFLKAGAVITAAILIASPFVGDKKDVWEANLASQLSEMYPSANITADTVKDLNLADVDFTENATLEARETVLTLNSSPSTPEQLLTVNITPVVKDGHLRLFLNENDITASSELPRANQFVLN